MKVVRGNVALYFTFVVEEGGGLKVKNWISFNDEEGVEVRLSTPLEGQKIFGDDQQSPLCIVASGGNIVFMKIGVMGYRIEFGFEESYEIKSGKMLENEFVDDDDDRVQVISRISDENGVTWFVCEGGGRVFMIEDDYGFMFKPLPDE
ncbi:hypothetical protein CO172_02565 [Candidatus Uhrbacteria bacterium CG_4_9_14_3_um_filter_36_7]|uniref:Uncharacterized protein n=1 Tax=Candidatus Uhrbacteria bacterium CG_4_9_14_3_um_filter_36_7 TaxID=1975033 RepID=A0A2M7XH92_9BACT|nr:MAG: hypothetical protein CO172_02565 [Candidatus Uhrbacteria bacterium CG_4_9_14_3_um_filter_36_7]